MWLFNLLFSSLSQPWYVEVRISRSILVSPLDFEITRVDCIYLFNYLFIYFLHLRTVNLQIGLRIRAAWSGLLLFTGWLILSRIKIPFQTTQVPWTMSASGSGFALFTNTVSPLYFDTGCNDKIRYNDNFTGTKPLLQRWQWIRIVFKTSKEHVSDIC